MSLLSIFARFRRQASPDLGADASGLSPATLEETRVRARRRLIGMAVLVGVGVLGFPWLFETQPRPMSQDVQVVQAPDGAEGEAISGLAVTGAGRAPHSVAGRVHVASVQAARPDGEQPDQPPTARPDDEARGQDQTSTKPPVMATEHAPAPLKAADKPVDKPAAKPALKEPAHKDAPKPEADKAHAKAEDKPASSKGAPDKTSDKAATRYVVQVGAFAELASAQASRMKIERLGIKTYAQEVSTPAGKRIRVRVGPFADKAEADKALANLRKAGVNGAVLTL